MVVKDTQANMPQMAEKQADAMTVACGQKRMKSNTQVRTQYIKSAFNIQKQVTVNCYLFQHPLSVKVGHVRENDHAKPVIFPLLTVW